MHAHRTSRTFGAKALLVLAAGFFALGSTQANSQMVLLAGGNLVSNSTVGGSELANRAGMQLGGRFWLTDLFQVQGVLAYQDQASAEASLLLRPFIEPRTLDPYAFVGFGTFLDADAARTVVPIGAGVEYRLNNHLGLLFEVAGRWTLNDHNRAYRADLDFGLVPSFGISYYLSRPTRPAPPERVIWTEAEPPVVVESPAEETASVAESTGTNGHGETFIVAPDEPVVLVEETPAAEVAPTTLFSTEAEADIRLLAVPEPADADTVMMKVRDNMVLIPDGTFILGLTDEDPLQLQTAGLRRITLSRFYVDQHEVSNADYRSYLAEMSVDQRAAWLPDTTMGQASGNRFSWSEYLRGPAYARHPVVGVTYAQAEAYCLANGKRLPTEAEWEYAARAGQIGGVYPWYGLEPRAEDGQFMANHNPGRGGYAADGFAFTAPVDAFPPSRWGLFNMSGNVAEWVQDTFHPSYATLADFNPVHLDPTETRRGVRGGSWASDAFYIGVGVRDAQPAGEASPYVGFRCVMDVTQENE